MAKTNLIYNIVKSLQETDSQSEKKVILEKYKLEKMLERIVSIAYNPWIDFKMQDFETVKRGKDWGMGISKFLHIVDDMIDNKLDAEQRRFSCNMALTHMDSVEAPLFISIVKQELDLGLEIDTINAVWPGLIMQYPIRFATFGDTTDFQNFPACVQSLSLGLRVNVIVNNNTVSYRDKNGNAIEGWDCWDEQFINLAQGQETVFDGHAVTVDADNNVTSNKNDEILNADPKTVRFRFWDAIRYDGFIRGKDTRIGYNWRYNGLEHMMMLAVEKNKQPCYMTLPTEIVGSQEQLDETVKRFKNKCVIKPLDGIWYHGETDKETIIV